jgi:hypothetical protein
MRSHTPFLFLFSVTIVAVLALASPLVAQEGDRSGVTVTGQVRDGSTDAPIAGAAVVLPKLRRSAVTDSAGMFRFSDLAEGVHEWMFVALGYTTLEQESRVEAGDHLTIGLHPKPIMLEGITVDGAQLDRLLNRRRNSAMEAVQLFDRDRLLDARSFSMRELVRSRITTVMCPNEMELMWIGECVRWHGHIFPMSVFIDELPADVPELAGYHAAEVYALEIWNGGMEIRVFTNSFAERYAVGQASFRPRRWSGRYLSPYPPY